MIETWKTDKADWCCLNELVGCGFNCSAGYSKWKSGGSTLKKKYCCKNELLGCTFNCSKDLSNRSLAWPSMKKAWCCKNEKVGCGEEKKTMLDTSRHSCRWLFASRLGLPTGDTLCVRLGRTR